MTVALPIDLTGTFNNPSISLNMQQAVNSLTQKIIDSQKDRLQEKGKDILTDIITGKTTRKDTATTGQSRRTDTTKTQEEVVKDAARDILGGILGGKKKKKDTTDQ